jgi:hypothetical protein
MEIFVISRISDLRVTQAQQFGLIVGLPREEAHQIAMIADLLTATHTWDDLTFMFDGLAHHTGPVWIVPVNAKWTMAFEWVDGFGPVNIHLL